MDEVIAALESLDHTGSFFSSRQASITDFDIKLNKVGPLIFPLTKDQIDPLIAMAKPAQFGWCDQTILDESVRKVWEIPKNKVKIGKKQWRAKFEPLLKKIKTDLGLPEKSTLTADLHNMLIYEPGHFFKPHQDSEKTDGMVATLVVVLPSQYDGGELIVDHNGVKQSFKFKASQLNKFSCVSFYADCYHEVQPVTSGYRVTLTYNLVLENYRGGVEILYEQDFGKKLAKALQNYFVNELSDQRRRHSSVRKMVYLLDHQYTQKGLSWDSLKNTDRTRVNALLKIANDLNLTAHLALADIKECWECEFDGGHHSYRYGDDDDEEECDDDDEMYAIPDYILATDTVLKYWIDQQGKHVEYKPLSPRSDEVCWTGGNDDFEPYESEYEAWMGNYGNTLDRWYHRAAIVLWGAADHYPLLFEIDMSDFAQELFTLVDTQGSREKLQAMLQETVAYWESYASKHADEQDIMRVLTLARYLKNDQVSAVLLTAYQTDFFNISTLPVWLELIKEYGASWWLKIFNAITAKEQRGRANRNSSFKSFTEIMQQLVAVPACQPIINWLIHYQQEAIYSVDQAKDITEGAYQRLASRRVDEVIDFMQGTLIVNDKKNHLGMMNIILNDSKTYPSLLLVGLFDACVPRLNPSDLKDWGYRRFFGRVYTALKKEEAQGLRRQDDWSIQVKSKCNCADCNSLNEFLAQADNSHVKWPLAEGRRGHLSCELDRLGIPVFSRTEKKGRPYTLAIIKTSELYSEAKKRYAAVQVAKAVLDQKWQSLLGDSEKFH